MNRTPLPLASARGLALADRDPTSADLPCWAENPLGRELVAAVLRDRPEPRTRVHKLPSLYGGYPDGTSVTYVGKPCSLLRKMHREWLQKEYTRLDRSFAITGHWDHLAGRAIHEIEDANALIARVLASDVREAA